MARPLEFDPDKAREALMKLFWQRGFDGASMQDAEAATGLNKQSLYRQFGNKRQMYLAALEHYRDAEMEAVGELLARPGDARTRIGHLLEELVEQAIRSGDRRGCFLCNAAVDQAPHDAETAETVGRLMEYMTQMIGEALRADQSYRQNPELCAARTAHLVAGYFGLRILIRAGQPPEMLRRAAADLTASV